MVSEITTITMAAMFTAVAVALFINYLMTALGYMGCMKKAGVESWKAWIPVYNEYVMYKVVNLKGFLIIFKILYLIVATVYLCFTFSFIGEITEKADELVNNSSYTREASVSQNNVYRNKVKSTEVNVDIDDEEFDPLDDVDITFPEDKESLFRMCLAYTAEHDRESIFKDLSPEDEAINERILEEVRKLIDENEYEDWKQKYLNSEYDKIKDHHFLVVSYMFAGFGGYDDVIPEEQFESFICWINGNGSAFFTGKRDAEEDDVKRYIALHANDDIAE